ncbi:MAG: hypothetical protein EOP06_12985 [Proteobacteria bacterium]|nr:MAG: hypothetical protein EOP06_12985 [Pseudomonadota bacterium]
MNQRAVDYAFLRDTENEVETPSVEEISKPQKDSLKLVRPKDSRRDFEKKFDRADSNSGRTPRGRLAARATIPVADIKEFLPEWLGECEYVGQSSMTIRGKRGAIERFLWWLETEELEDVGVREVKRYLTYLTNAHLTPFGRFDEGLKCRERSRDPRRGPNAKPITPNSAAFREISDRTIQLYFVYIKGFFGYMASEEIGLIPISPLETIKAPSATKARIQPLDVHEVSLLEKAASKEPTAKRDIALLYFLVDTGARESEVAGIRIHDLKLNSGTATVLGKGNKRREIFFEVDTRRHLKAYLKEVPYENEDDYLFRAARGLTRGEGLTASGILQLIKRLGEKAGVKDKRCTPHTLRHSYATWFIREGGTAKALQVSLGHEGMEQTMGYVEFVDADAKNQHRKASPGRLLRQQRRKVPR